jgi:hypothetical protein
MSAIGNVSVRFIANSAGLLSGANDAGKAFRVLGGDASTLRTALSAVEKAGRAAFGDLSPGAAAARAEFTSLASEAIRLRTEFSSGAISADQFATGMQGVSREAQAAAAAIKVAREAIKNNQTALDDYLARMQELDDAVRLAGLSESVAAAERTKAAKAYLSAKDAAEGEAAALTDLSGITLPDLAGSVANDFVAATAGLGDFTAEAEAMSAAAVESRVALEAMTSAAAAEAAMLRRAEEVTRDNRTAQEVHADTLEELRTLYQAGTISVRTYNAAVEKADDVLRRATTATTRMATATSTADSALAGINRRLNSLIGLQAAQLFGSISSQVSAWGRSLVSAGYASGEAIDQTAKFATSLGFTYSEMAKLRTVSDLFADVSLDGLAKGMTKADITLTKAAGGSEQAAKAFEGIGLNIAALQAQSPAERFSAISEAIAKLPSEAQRAAAAVAIFGRSGAELLPVFNEGGEAVAAAMRDAERFGLTLTDAQKGSVESMFDAFNRAGQAISGVTGQVTAYLAPAVDGIVTQFNEFIASVGGANIGQAIGDGILAGAEYLAGVADWLVSGFSDTFEYLSQVGEQWSAVTDFLSRTASFFSGMWNAAEAAMGMMVIAFSSAFQGIAEIAQSIGGYLGFDTSTLDAVVEGAKAFNAEIDRGITENVNAASADFAKAFGDGAPAVGQAIAGPMTNAVRSWREQARQNASKADEAKKPRPGESEAKELKVTGVTEALKGVDSRSKEGVAEMFRLMRGTPDSAANRTADASERTADLMEDLVDGMQDDVEFAIP